MTPSNNHRQPNIHQPKVILVTGGCGYLGSALIRALARDQRFEGITIRILDNMQAANYSALMALPETGRFQFIEGDILDPVVVELALQDVDTVVHLAAIVRTPISFENPAWMEQVNHWGTARFVEECLAAGVSRFIYTSTTAVYGPGGPFKETDPCRPVGPYAHSKHLAEQSIVTSINRGLQSTILRLGTLYGYAEAMRFDALPNRFVYLARIGQSLTVYGDGTQKRPIIHVDDACEAVLFALSNQEGTQGRVFNVAGDNSTVLDMVAAVKKSEPEISVRYTNQDVLSHISFDVDGSAIVAAGFQPKHSLQEGIAELLGRFEGLELFTTLSPEN